MNAVFSFAVSRAKTLLGLALIFLVCSSCSEKPGEAAFPREMIDAFSRAGIPLQSGKIAARDFSLPLAVSADVPAALRKNQRLASLKGKVVFLNFWATWCEPCRAEMPSMESLYSQYKEKGLEIIAVNSGETLPEVLAFMTDNGFSFPALLDIDGDVSHSYAIRAIPTSFLIDREGGIILRVMGSINWDTPEIRAALDLLLD